MRAVAWIAVALGVFRESRALGILMAVVALPALAMTSRESARYRDADRPLSALQKVVAFADSVCQVVGCLVVLLFVIAIAAFIALSIFEVVHPKRLGVQVRGMS
jgi:hypothetical protein